MNVIKVVVYCFFSQEKLEIMLVNTQVPRDTKAMVAKVFFHSFDIDNLLLEIIVRLIIFNTKCCHGYIYKLVSDTLYHR